ncbi:hypothetical protein OG203_03950 [Nocardia sp. NBC_01499]|uniref:hypothetical protein n=1 Tax=Nocardia sp. NBC_01499 TaxID=2903597 RepID=UPI0038668D8B
MPTVPRSTGNDSSPAFQPKPKWSRKKRFTIIALALLAGLAVFAIGDGAGRSGVRRDAETTATAAANAAVPQQVAAAVQPQRDALDRSEADLKTRDSAVTRRETAVGQAETTMTGREQTADQRDADLTRRETAVVPKEAAAAKSSFGDGVWQVGQDIYPGTYRTSGGTDCYWERMSNLSGDSNSILANDIVTGPTVVTILSSDAGFTSKDCGTWTKTG